MWEIPTGNVGLSKNYVIWNANFKLTYFLISPLYLTLKFDKNAFYSNFLIQKHANDKLPGTIFWIKRQLFAVSSLPNFQTFLDEKAILKLENAVQQRDSFAITLVAAKGEGSLLFQAEVLSLLCHSPLLHGQHPSQSCNCPLSGNFFPGILNYQMDISPSSRVHSAEHNNGVSLLAVPSVWCTDGHFPSNGRWSPYRASNWSWSTCLLNLSQLYVLQIRWPAIVGHFNRIYDPTWAGKGERRRTIWKHQLEAIDWKSRRVSSLQSPLSALSLYGKELLHSETLKECSQVFLSIPDDSRSIENAPLDVFTWVGPYWCLFGRYR